MKELLNARQIAGEPRRRWFSSQDFDLIVWLSEGQGFIGFELCYDKRGRERSLLWNLASGFSHMAVDNGEQRPGKFKSSPTLLPDGNFEAQRVCADFLAASGDLPAEVRDYVLENIERHPAFLEVSMY